MRKHNAFRGMRVLTAATLLLSCAVDAQTPGQPFAFLSMTLTADPTHNTGFRDDRSPEINYTYRGSDSDVDYFEAAVKTPGQEESDLTWSPVSSGRRISGRFNPDQDNFVYLRAVKDESVLQTISSPLGRFGIRPHQLRVPTETPTYYWSSPIGVSHDQLEIAVFTHDRQQLILDWLAPPYDSRLQYQFEDGKDGVQVSLERGRRHETRLRFTKDSVNYQFISRPWTIDPVSTPPNPVINYLSLPDKKGKYKILIILDRFNETFRERVLNAFFGDGDSGLFKIAPFADKKNRFIIDYTHWNHPQRHNFSHEYETVVILEPNTGSAITQISSSRDQRTILLSAYLGDLDYFADLTATFVHEFGHAFATLYDEYTVAIGTHPPVDSRNCEIPGTTNHWLGIDDYGGELFVNGCRFRLRPDAATGTGCLYFGRGIGRGDGSPHPNCFLSLMTRSFLPRTSMPHRWAIRFGSVNRYYLSQKAADYAADSTRRTVTGFHTDKDGRELILHLDSAYNVDVVTMNVPALSVANTTMTRTALYKERFSHDFPASDPISDGTHPVTFEAFDFRGNQIPLLNTVIEEIEIRNGKIMDFSRGWTVTPESSRNRIPVVSRSGLSLSDGAMVEIHIDPYCTRSFGSAQVSSGDARITVDLSSEIPRDITTEYIVYFYGRAFSSDSEPVNSCQSLQASYKYDSLNPELRINYEAESGQIRLSCGTEENLAMNNGGQDFDLAFNYGTHEDICLYRHEITQSAIPSENLLEMPFRETDELDPDDQTETAEPLPTLSSISITPPRVSEGGFSIIRINLDSPATPRFYVHAQAQDRGEHLSETETFIYGNIFVKLTQSSADSISNPASARDYSLSSNLIIIPIGATYAETIVTAVDDGINEPTEEILFKVEILNTGTTRTASWSIEDNDMPVLSLAVPPTFTPGNLVSASSEEGRSFNFRLQLNRAAATNTVVQLTRIAENVQDIPLASEEDYSLSTTRIVIPAGETRADVRLTLFRNDGAEPVEILILRAVPTDSLVLTGQPEARITIINVDQPRITGLSFVPSRISEHQGSADLVLTLDPPPFTTVTVSRFIRIGAAREGEDYRPLPTNFPISPGSTQKRVVLSLINDDVNEGEETVVVFIRDSVLSGVTLNTQLMTTLIIEDDDDLQASLQAAPGVVTEGGIATFTVHLNRTSDQFVAINLFVTGSAFPSNDYTLSSDLAIIAPGNTRFPVTLTALADDLPEPPEDVIMEISPQFGRAQIGSPSTARIIIADDNTVRASLRAAPEAINEGAAATVTVHLNRSTTTAVKISLSSTGTAVAGEDYTLSSNSVTIAAGETASSVTLAALADDLPELSEDVILKISPQSGNVQIGSPSTARIIISDTSTLVVSLRSTLNLLEKGDHTTITVVFSRTLPHDAIISIETGGDAVRGQDYTLSTDTVVLAASETEAEFTLTASEDADIEDDSKTVTLTPRPVTPAPESGLITVNEDSVLQLRIFNALIRIRARVFLEGALQ